MSGKHTGLETGRRMLQTKKAICNGDVAKGYPDPLGILPVGLAS